MTHDIDERPAEAPREHPPLRMRGRRSILLPDLRPPTLEEIRWLSQHRRERRAAQVVAAKTRTRRAQVAPPPVVEEVPAAPDEPAVVLDLLVFDDPVVADDPVSVEEAEPVAEAIVAEEPAVADVPAVVDEPVVADEPPPSIEPIVEATEDLDQVDAARNLDLDFRPVAPILRDWYAPRVPEPSAAPDDLPEEPKEPEFEALQEPELAPWRPAPALEEIDDEGEPGERFGHRREDPPPLVSHLLVVREPVPFAPERVAVLDEPAPTITRLVPLPAEPADDLEVTSVVAPALDPTPFHDWAENHGLLIEPVLDPHPDVHYEPLPEVPKQWDGRPAPLYWRVLRLRYVRPNGWLRALFFEGSVAVAVVLVLAEAASVWTIVVLPIVVAGIVKANDVLAGNLRRNLGSNDGDSPPSER